MDNLNDHTLECPRCGRVFSLELTRCPQCGLNIYPDDEDDLTVGAHGMRPDELRPDGMSPDDVLPDSLPSSGLGEALGGIVLGWIVAGAVSFMLHMFASRAGTLETLPTLWQSSPVPGGAAGGAVGRVRRGSHGAPAALGGSWPGCAGGGRRGGIEPAVRNPLAPGHPAGDPGNGDAGAIMGCVSCSEGWAPG